VFLALREQRAPCVCVRQGRVHLAAQCPSATSKLTCLPKLILTSKTKQNKTLEEESQILTISTHTKKYPKQQQQKKPKQLPLLYCSCCSFAHDQQPPGHASQAPYAFLQERATCPTSPRFAYVGWKWERVTCAKATLLSPACLVLLLPMTHRGHSWQSCMGGVWHSLIVYEHAVYLSISHKCLW